MARRLFAQVGEGALAAFLSLTSIVVLAFTPATAGAALFDVLLVDNNGPQISGQVDTTTDQFTITGWSENGGGTALWTASDLPRVYTARTDTGALFDVPDAWDGTIGLNWAFINLVGTDVATWNEGTQIFSGHYDGWGGRRSGSSYWTAADETAWIWVPTAPGGLGTANFDTVSVTAALPTPTSVTLTAFGLAALLGTRATRRGRGRVPGSRGSR